MFAKGLKIKDTSALSRKKSRVGTAFAIDDMKNVKQIVIDKVTTTMPPPNFRPLIAAPLVPTLAPVLVENTHISAPHLVALSPISTRTYLFLHEEEDEKV